MSDKEITERFFKHRRNMLLLSGIFIFLVLSGGTIESINILGSRLKFNNPNVPVKLLFVSLLYMQIKYFQFLYELNGTGIKGKIYSIVSKEIPSIVRNIANSNANKDLGFSVDDYAVVGQKKYFTFEVIQKFSSGDNDETSKELDEKISDRYEVGFKQLWRVYVKAAFHVVIRTTWLAEYIMPLTLSAFGIYLYLFTDIHEVVWLKL